MTDWYECTYICALLLAPLAKISVSPLSTPPTLSFSRRVDRVGKEEEEGGAVTTGRVVFHEGHKRRGSDADLRAQQVVTTGGCAKAAALVVAAIEDLSRRISRPVSVLSAGLGAFRKL